MKKITAIFFLLTFLVANTGMAVTVHYCSGKLSSVNFFSLHNHPCKCGKKLMKKECCKDKTTILKVKSDLVKTNLTTFKISTLKHQLLLKPFEFVTEIHTQMVVLPLYPSPPFKPKSPIYLLDRVFLI